MFFAGWTSTLLIVPRLADKKGRKWIFFISVLSTTLLMLGLLLSKSVNLTIALMFFLGMFASGRIMAGYVYGNEFCTAKWQVVFGTSWNVGEAVTYTMTAVYFDWISKYYWYLSLVALVYLVFSMSVLLFFAPESPLWLLKTGQTQKAFASLRKILLFNGVEPEEVDILLNDQFDKIGKINESKRLDSAASQQLESTTDMYAGTQAPETQTSFYVRQRPI